MITLDKKLKLLKVKIEDGSKPISIMIIGLGSVGCYLLDYLVSKADNRINIIVVGRNREKLTSDVNIIKTAACIRGQLKSRIFIDSDCDLNDINSIAGTLLRWHPDFIVNSSRAYPGLKYGSISWSNFRAYGIWAPLSIKYARNIMLAYELSDCKAITINTSYSDGVIPWLKSAGHAYYDFGSGNLNHLIPRLKSAVSEQYGCNIDDIDITMSISHFHDVVISKEGQSEGVDVPIAIKINGREIEFNKDELFSKCAISMPTDAKRNMMNASSNYEIISSVIEAFDNNSIIKIHTPGFSGEIGGYPVVIDGTSSNPSAKIDESVFEIGCMRSANIQSINLDGIENIKDGTLIYTDKLISTVKSAFGCDLPKKVHFSEIDNVAGFLIENIISKAQ